MLLKALLYVIAVIIAFCTVVLIVAADQTRGPDYTRRPPRHRR